MSRDEFMRQLERLLEDVAEEEKREALSFYRSYFEDAGVENEAQILKELESPEKVAAIIKAGTGMDGAAGTGEYTERGFEDSRFEQKHPVDIRKNTKEQQSGSGPSGQEYAGYEDRNEYDYENASFDSGKSSSNSGDGRSTYGGRSTAEILLIVVLAIVTSPIWIGIVGGVAGGIFGLAVSVVCIAGSFYIAGGALVGVGGQRRGLGIGGKQDGNGSRWFVLDKDVEKNILYVSQGEMDVLFHNCLETDDFNFIPEKPAESEFECLVRIRHRQALQKAKCFIKETGGIKLVFEQKQRAIAEGQYAVVYRGKYCIGGGVIERKYNV